VALATRRLAPGARILELGCGTGRITLPLARAGFRVTALDGEPAMLRGLAERLARAPRSVAARVTPVAGDLRELAVSGRFALVIAGFNVLEHLYTRVELDACLRRVRALLTPDGAFAFDVQVPDLVWLSRDPSRRWSRLRFRHPSTGQPTWYSTNHDYDPVSQIAIIRLYYQPVAGGRETTVLLSQRKYFPAELEALVAHAGLRVAERYGDFAGGPLGPTSDSQFLVCTRVRSRAPRRG
jgi:SAM-dependent methyltransferase